MPHRPRLTAVLSAAALVASLTAPAYAATTADPTPGAPGVGDPYFPKAGNGGYDAEHYDLRLAWWKKSGRLHGTARISARATQDLSRFDLDLRGFTISELTVDGVRARYSRAGQELRITPLVPIASGQRFAVKVTYAGVPRTVTDPDGALDGWIPTDDGVFVASEPQGSPSWFPVNDHPTDKATYTVSMRVPKGLKAVGNGTLDTVRRGRVWTTWVWREHDPMASYLTTITIGRFDVTRSRTTDGIPLYVAVDPRLARRSAAVLARIPEILAYEQSVFGDYPFESAGAIVDRAPKVGYALETQTKPVFDSAPDTTTMVHELAHQWFGDSVSLTSWKEIWLNEGFAQYAEWLWSEHKGRNSAQEIFDDLYATPASDRTFWNPPSGNPGGPENIFDDTVYERGAMTLQALRGKIGDADFFEVLRTWATTHRHANATTAQFQALAEQVSGQDLDAFFTTWLETRGKPDSW